MCNVIKKKCDFMKNISSSSERLHCKKMKQREYKNRGATGGGGLREGKREFTV